MCGIVGIVDRQGPVEAEGLQRMLAAVRHRGPDEFGLYLYQDGGCSVGLGNARLSIIDLAGGQQPIGNETGRLWIVYNGEVYNYRELQAELRRRGHCLATDSDTEVILHLYEEYGAACLDWLNGQFALAIWDEGRRELFLARDRLGVRPLYYSRPGHSLIFGSEIKALLASGRVAAHFDPVALNQIFTYWSPLSPRTAFAGIATLPPGHWLRLGADGAMEMVCYWRPSFTAGGDSGKRPDMAEAAEQLGALLADATRIRLRADVPVGAYLSGGLDSSAITALARQQVGGQLETFSIAFADASYDESSYQQQMVAHLGTRHHLITCTDADVGRVFPEVIWHTETPVLRTAPAPMYLLSRLVHDHQFKVVLTGEGADEFWAGYNIFKEDKVRRFWARRPESVWRPLLLRRLYPYIQELAQGNDAYLFRFFGQGLTEVDRPDYSHAIRWQNGRYLRRFLSPEVAGVGAAELVLPPEFMDWPPLARAQYWEISIFLAEYLLSSQGDRVAMAHAVEGRFPFLDHRLVEFANSLPPGFKLRGLRREVSVEAGGAGFAAGGYLATAEAALPRPDPAQLFPDKRPLPWVADLLSAERVGAAGCFAPEAVGLLQRKVERGGKLSEMDEMALAGILSTQLVHDLFIAHYRPPDLLSEGDNLKIVRRGVTALVAGKAVIG